MTHQTGPPPEKEDRARHQHVGDPATTVANGNSDDTATSLGSYALGLAAAYLAVLPLLPRDKRPRFCGSFHNATCDPEWIDQHWYYHPRDNVGIRPPWGMAVLDVDGRHGGWTSLSRLRAEHGPLPETWSVRTGSGGRHLWFVVGEMELRGHLAPGIDIKHGENGYVVAPRSVHPNGVVYQWLSPPLGEPATAPTWLRERLRAPVYDRSDYEPRADVGTGHGPYSLACLLGRITSAVEGRRHVVVYGAFKDAAAQGDLDIFEADLTAAALAIGLPRSRSTASPEM